MGNGYHRHSGGQRLPLLANTFGAPFNSGLVQWSARRFHNPKVSGSNPLPATNADVVKLVDTSALGADALQAWGFKSLRRYQKVFYEGV